MIANVSFDNNRLDFLFKIWSIAVAIVLVTLIGILISVETHFEKPD